MQNTQLVTLVLLAALLIFMMRVGGSHTQQNFNLKEVAKDAGFGAAVGTGVGLAGAALFGGLAAAATVASGGALAIPTAAAAASFAGAPVAVGALSGAGKSVYMGRDKYKKDWGGWRTLDGLLPDK